jgi:AraC-like DNA-binding protein
MTPHPPEPPTPENPPTAATRYLFHSRPAGRLTCLFQGRIPLRGRGNHDRIAPYLPAEELRNDGRQPIWGITIILAGAVTVRDRLTGETARLTTGSWFQFLDRPAQTIHLQNPTPDFQEAAISCDRHTGTQLALAGLWRRDPWHARSPPDPALTAACRDLHRALLQLHIGTTGLLRRLAHVLELAYTNAETAGDHPTPPPGPPTPTRNAARAAFRTHACRLLSAHPEPAFAITDAARHLGLGVENFRKKFRSVVGVPPGTWHMQRRIEKATALLATMSVVETARELGYPDAFAFSRQFKRVTGVAPKVLRR